MNKEKVTCVIVSKKYKSYYVSSNDKMVKLSENIDDAMVYGTEDSAMRRIEQLMKRFNDTFTVKIIS